MKRTQSILKTQGQLRLHKITSNKTAVMEAFEPCDLGKILTEIDSDETVHTQKSWIVLESERRCISILCTNDRKTFHATRSIVNY